MRQHRAEIEKLQRTQQRWRYPEQQQIGNRDMKQMQQHIEQNRHAHDLLPGDIISDEMHVPLKEIFMNAIVKIRVFGTGRVFMMIPVLGQQILVRKQSIDKDDQRANGIIDFSIAREDSAVHGVVSCDEKTCVEECLPEDGKQN